MEWFTADTHFHHANIIRYCDRPFESVEQMNETMIARWNERVQRCDTVFHLGDFGFGSREGLAEIRRRLNGRIMLVIGNHDRKRDFDLFDGVSGWMRMMDPNVVLAHKPGLGVEALRTGAFSRDAVVLHGHNHGAPVNSTEARFVDVGVDCWGFRPVSLDEVLERIK